MIFWHHPVFSVNSDGSLSRIQNWAGMAADEREKTARMILARNEKRLQALKKTRAEDERAEPGALSLEDAPRGTTS